MDWQKLEDLNEDRIWRGAVFRFPAEYPFESFVDFMIYDDFNSPSGFSFICTTGQKAGLVEVQLPKEALCFCGDKAVSREWLVDNWGSWVYPKTPVKDVMVISNYPAQMGSVA